MDLSTLAMGNGQQAHDDVKDIGATVLQWQHDKAMQGRSVKGSAYLNEQMARLSRDARQTSALDMVTGLRAAGLNPALAQGGSFGSVSSGGTAPAPSTSAAPAPRSQMAQLALESLKYSESERDLMAAQSRNLNAEAQGKEIQNSNNMTTNSTIDKLLRQRLQEETTYWENFAKANGGDSDAVLQSEQYKVLKSLLDAPMLNQGTLSALDAYFTSKERSLEHPAKILSARIEKDIKSKQFYDPEFADKLAALPKHEADIAANSAAEIYANILYLAMSRQLTEANIDLAEESIKQIQEAIKVMKDNDVVGLFESGNYDALGVKWLYDNLPKVLNMLGLAGFAVQYGRRAGQGVKPVKNIQTPMQQLGY